jgi:hypothetical protein
METKVVKKRTAKKNVKASNEPRYSINVLRENIYLKLKDYKFDKKLKKKLIEDFYEKGLGSAVPNLVIEGSIEIEQLDEKTELICLAKSMHEYLSNKFGDNTLNLTDYLSSDAIKNYITGVIPRDEKSNIVVLRDVTKVNNKTYMTYVTAEEMSKMRKNRNYSNLQGFQRPRVKKTTRSGKEYEVIDVNKEGVIDLKNRFIKGDIFPTAMSFAVLELEGKEPKYNFIEHEDKIKIEDKTKTTGTLYINTNYNIDDIEYTPFPVIDGYHRTTGLVDAFDEEERNGRYLDNGLYAIINIMTENEARQYVIDSLQRNDVKNKEALNAMTPSNSNNFVNIIIKSSNVLKNNVTDSYNKIKTFNKLTSQMILEDSVNLSHFSIGNEIRAEREAEKVGNIIDLLIGDIKDSFFDGNVDKMKETYLLAPHMFAGYIAIANKLVRRPDYKKIIAVVSEELYLLVDNESVKELELNDKKCKVEDVFNHFNKFMEEDIDV